MARNIRKRGHLITLFVITQLLLCACITLWIVWFVYAKNSADDFLNIAKSVSVQVNYTELSWSRMVFGILFLSGILIGSTLMFIELMRTRIQIRQSADLSVAFTHELATPLTCILMNLEAILTNNKLSQENRSYLLSAAYKESRKMKRSLDQIFDLKRIEYDNFTIKPQETNFTHLLERLCDHFRDGHPEASILYTDNCNVELFSLIDPHYFEMALSNLIENGIKYTHTPNPHLKIDLSFSGKKIFLSVADNGIGIEPKKLKKVFRMFYRENPNIRGNGMGLFLVKTIIKKHKGSVYALSEGLGKGTIFTIELPLIKVAS